MRVLFVTFFARGHLNPMAALVERSGNAAIMLHSAFSPCPRSMYLRVRGLRRIHGEAPVSGYEYCRAVGRGVTAIEPLWEGVVVPVTAASEAPIEKAIAAFRADVIIADEFNLAGPAFAQAGGTAYATSSHPEAGGRVKFNFLALRQVA